MARKREIQFSLITAKGCGLERWRVWAGEAQRHRKREHAKRAKLLARGNRWTAQAFEYDKKPSRQGEGIGGYAANSGRAHKG